MHHLSCLICLLSSSSLAPWKGAKKGGEKAIVTNYDLLTMKACKIYALYLENLVSYSNFCKSRLGEILISLDFEILKSWIGFQI